ncbi:MAG: acetate kinase [Myxococcales bacterium]
MLCLNAGSSSLKFAVQAGDERLAQGAVEGVGLDRGRFWLLGRSTGGEAQPRKGAAVDREDRFPDHVSSVRSALDALEAADLHPQAVAHRLVHGGPVHHAPTLVDEALLDSLRGFVPFARLHLPAEIAVIEATLRRYPGLPQVACFDTHFHWELPEVSRRLPLPSALYEQGVRRYGFHGLSYEYVVSTLEAARHGRVVIAHLGNGASLAAVREGRPIDTTMALTPASGVMMGTRTGDLDPGVVLFLLARGVGLAEVERLVTRESGLLGVSGSTSDMKGLLAARPTDPRAALAVEMFCGSCRKAVGALAAALGGLDTLVFTGGIGENAAPIREEICAGLAHLGVTLDDASNRAGAPLISAAGSRCAVCVIRTDEDLVLARHAHGLLA